MTVFFTAVSAIVPSLLLLWYFHSRDVNPEPAKVVWATFALGVLIVLPVLVVALPLDASLRVVTDPYLLGISSAFLSAALPEELFKFLVLTQYCVKRPEFDEPMDGIVYGVVVSLGFATLENIMYVAGGGPSLAVIRAVTAVPGHAFLGVIMGYYVGRAHFEPARKTALLATGYCLAAVLHGLYDFPVFTYKQMDKLMGHAPGAKKAIGTLAGWLLLLTVAVLLVEWVWAITLVRRVRAVQLAEQRELARTAAAATAAAALVAQAAGATATAPLATEPMAVPPVMEVVEVKAADFGLPLPAPRLPARPGAWILLGLGGLLASCGGLVTLGLIGTFVFGTLGEQDSSSVLLGGMLVGALPLGIGLALFANGLRRLHPKRAAVESLDQSDVP